MSLSYINNIDFIVDGQPVNASITNKPIEQLNNNINYLKQIVESITTGQRIIINNAVLESSTLVGQPVYFNNVNQRYEAAIADDTEKQNVIGIVLEKQGPTLGTILLQGYAVIDMSNAITPITPGAYYLSKTNPGKLDLQPNTRSPFVCFLAGTDLVWVFPKQNEPISWQQKAVSATGTTIDTNFNLLQIQNNTGLWLTGTIKNAGATNDLVVREEATDSFGISDSVETTVTAGNNLILSIQSNKGSAFPPFTDYKIFVRSLTSGNPTSYNLKVVYKPY